MEKNSNTKRREAWTSQEDNRLTACVQKYGEGRWGFIATLAGLNRCRKSCRLRWLNYLKPDLKRGDFEADEIDLILRMHALLGNRWTLIAGRLPGRTANDVKNYWNLHLKDRPNKSSKKITRPKKTRHTIIKPRPHALPANYSYYSSIIRPAQPAKITPTLALPEAENSIGEIRQETMDGRNGADWELCNNGAVEENVAHNVETNAAGDNADDSQLMSPWSYCLPGDVDFSDVFDALYDNDATI